MNFCGIICEFNPFHNGHEYIIQEAKKQTNAEIVCVMSGDFVQRGEPAIEDKYSRAKKAINAGANAVLELPTIYACSNAENFAYGAIKILNAIGAKYVAFGVENTTLEILKTVAKLKYENSVTFQNNFKNEIENGINFNTALKRSISKTLNDKNVLEILEKPNNILAVEYLTAILKFKSQIIPIAINRCDDGYYETVNKGKFLSASGIRNKIFNGEDYYEFIPKNAKLDTFFNKNHIKTLKTLQILKIKQTPEKELELFYDYSEGIEYRIKKMCNNYSSFDEIVSNIVSPRYRMARVNKLMLYPLLVVTKKVIEKSKATKPCAKVLAIEKNNKELLKTKKQKISLIVSNNDYNSLNKNQNEIINIDLNASTIYNTVFDNKLSSDKKIGTMFL